MLNNYAVFCSGFKSIIITLFYNIFNLNKFFKKGKLFNKSIYLKYYRIQNVEQFIVVFSYSFSNMHEEVFFNLYYIINA